MTWLHVHESFSPPLSSSATTTWPQDHELDSQQKRGFISTVCLHDHYVAPPSQRFSAALAPLYYPGSYPQSVRGSTTMTGIHSHNDDVATQRQRGSTNTTWLLKDNVETQAQSWYIMKNLLCNGNFVTRRQPWRGYTTMKGIKPHHVAPQRQRGYKTTMRLH